MEWFWGAGLLVIAFALVCLGKQIYELSKKIREEDGELEFLFELIDLVLNALEKEAKRRLSELEQDVLLSQQTGFWTRLLCCVFLDMSLAHAAGWHILAVKGWSILAVNTWYTLAVNRWYIHGRKLTTSSMVIIEAVSLGAIMPHS